MSNRVKQNNKVYNISYHIIWIPKYRKKILKGHIKEKLLIYLQQKADILKISIEEIEIMDDHIHLFIKANPSLSVSYIVKHLKGYTSYKLRKDFPYLKKYKALWTHSYYCETIGFISESTVRKYINAQTKHI